MVTRSTQGVLKTRKIMMDLLAVLMTLNVVQAPRKVTLVVVMVEDSVQQT